MIERALNRPGVSRPVVLIVEDDQLLKLLTVDLVEAAGFATLHAANADEALTILTFRSDIALLLTDVDMPGSIDGLELAEVVRLRWPAVKIIILSSRVPERDMPAGSQFLQKPYHAEKMISELHAMVGGP